MKKNSIQVGKIYVGGIEDRRRRVDMIHPDPKRLRGKIVHYTTVKANGKDGASKTCQLRNFAEWAKKGDPYNGAPYSKQKRAAIKKRRESCDMQQINIPGDHLYGWPW